MLSDMGMRTTERRSIPFWIPFEITAAVMTAVKRKKRTGRTPPVNEANGTVSPEREKSAYAAVHPAMTR